MPLIRSRTLVLVLVWVAITSVGLAACSAGSTPSASNLPNSPTTAPPTTTTAANAYFSLQGTESLINSVAAPYEAGPLQWGYVASMGDYEANTDGNYCNVALTNFDKEASGLIDNISFNCGLPLEPSSVTDAETSEAALIMSAVVAQDAGSDALSWFGAEASSTPITTQKQFGEIMVDINIGYGQSSVTVATTY